ncbi:Origin recognition complex subunit [Phytophthora palmivora]|uniref:Origin recognition complex subunit 1 n=1 Tax=Phytophthora palmivora TaxID=4796 RepID=A0A2P4XM04_9STRA|nr:Origin recognition complex subunit [Phytophthora palmivora]
MMEGNGTQVLHAGVKRPRNESSDNSDHTRTKISGSLAPAVATAVKKLQRACQELQLSSLPRVMTGREDERDEIYTALRSSIEQQSAGGPIYISGLPGAGKTSIVKEVIRTLEAQRDARKLRNFAWVEVNGLQMPRPDVAYSVLWKALQRPDSDEEERELQPSRISMSAARLCEILQREFHTKNSTRPMLLVLLDEMDFMLAGKNQVLYNLLEWQTSASAKLVLVGIANTMDLPERLPTKIRSRLGGHRITFPAYTRAQLENIIQQRLLQLDIFSEEAIQICAKSLAHQSGDVRQALSLCRKSAEVCLHRLITNTADESGELYVTGEDLHEAQQAVSVSAPMSRLRACSKFECTFLVALRMEVRSNAARGVNKSGAELEAVIERFAILCKTHAFVPIPRLRGLLFICDELERSGIIKQISARTSRYPLLELRCSHQELQDVFLTHPIGMQLIS